ncbi:group III truncated hemoglobin [Novosphingobium flavum]|uniref:Group III truncated hemoglobin n=1 Tax=Novosphingobium flavum TaxID=1778672 RepID=A0A7X1FQI9_9SPHN|nr:group III truncated hemoglobin [Novosphingobium flavum]MBC2665116.1 group III truncated hemoglobin [Novosphingobium flavum]
MSKPSRPAPLRKTGDLPDHARAARQRKRAEAEAMGIDEQFIDQLVERFYASVRADAVLGPIFAAKVEDWPAHLARLKQFWRSILHSSGEYTGNPMRQHLALPGLEASHFSRWLELFYQTLAELGSDDALREVGTRARMIADSLLTGLALHREGLTGAKAGAQLPWPAKALGSDGK